MRAGYFVVSPNSGRRLAAMKPFGLSPRPMAPNPVRIELACVSFWPLKMFDVIGMPRKTAAKNALPMELTPPMTTTSRIARPLKNWKTSGVAVCNAAP